MKKIFFATVFILSIALTSFAQNSVMDFYKADIEAIKASGMGFPNGEAEIQKKDISNGYIAYSLNKLGMMGFKQMAYFISNNGKKFAVVATFGCGPACSIDDFNFYELKNAKLVDKTAIYYPTSLKTQVDNAMKPYLEKGSYWIKVPQHGTTIQFGYVEGFAVDDTRLVVVCELQYNVNNGTFKFLKK